MKTLSSEKYCAHQKSPYVNMQLTEYDLCQTINFFFKSSRRAFCTGGKTKECTTAGTRPVFMVRVINSR